MDTLLGFVLATGATCVGFIIHLGNRVSVVETKHDSVEAWLERIEEKLDRVIERR